MPVGPASPQLPFPSHYQRFVISTFTFVEPPSMAVLEGEVGGGGGQARPTASPRGLVVDLRGPWWSPSSQHPSAANPLGAHGEPTLLGKGLGWWWGALCSFSGAPPAPSAAEAGPLVPSRSTSHAALPCATSHSPSPAAPPASWECPPVRLGAAGSCSPPPQPAPGGGNLHPPPLSIPTPRLSPGARRSPGHRRVAEGVGTVTSQGHIIFPKVPKLWRG